jgi:hypothetical protein
MKRLFIVVILLISLPSAFAQSDYYIKKAQSYQREAEYYQKKLMAIVAKLHTISKKQKDTSARLHTTQSVAT